MWKAVQTDIATFVSHTPERCTFCSRKRRLEKHKYSQKKSVDERKITQKTFFKKWQKKFYVLKHVIKICYEK